MNKFILAAGAAVTALVISACSGSTPETNTVTVTAPAPQQEILSDRDIKEEAYITSLRRSGNPILDSASDSDLLEVGYTVCDILSQGLTTQDIIEYMAREMVRDGITSDAYAEAVGYIIGASEVTLCSVTY